MLGSPKVETARKGLERLVVGKTTQKVQILWSKVIEQLETPIFEALLIGETIQSTERRGKFLIFHLDHRELTLHLRMEGKYQSTKENTPTDKHTHIPFFFEDESQLHYNDVRKFGCMTIVEKEASATYRRITKLRPEPLPDNFLLADSASGLKKSHKVIKSLLLDQRLVTGLGNIYVGEALWEAKIYPEQPTNTLRPKEVERLRLSITDVLDRAIEARGTTIRSYLDVLGESGGFQVALHVYQQTGKPCIRCGTPIVKIKVAQGGTRYCPNCQRLKIAGQDLFQV